MKTITTHYDITHLISVEITRSPRSRWKKINLIIGGEARQVNVVDILCMFNNLAEVKKDLKV